MSERTDVRRIRREPPRYIELTVRSVEPITERMTRVRLEGDVATLAPDLPAASVRLLLPSAPDGELVIPEWNGNEFLLPDGSRPFIRTLTPMGLDERNATLDVWIVTAHRGVLADWTRSVEAGWAVAVSGPGRGWQVPDGHGRFVVAGDESALPAMTQVLAALPAGAERMVFAEVGAPNGALAEIADAEWIVTPVGESVGMALAGRVGQVVGPKDYVWAAGEAAAMQRIRTRLFREVGLDRSRATVRGYWKRDRV